MYTWKCGKGYLTDDAKRCPLACELHEMAEVVPTECPYKKDTPVWYRSDDEAFEEMMADQARIYNEVKETLGDLNDAMKSYGRQADDLIDAMKRG